MVQHNQVSVTQKFGQNNHIARHGGHAKDPTMYLASNSDDKGSKRMTFDKQFPPVVPQERLNEQSKFDAAVATMRREGSTGMAIPGGLDVAIGLLGGRVVVRGPKSAVDKLRKNAVLMELKDITWIEEGPAPSNLLIAIDFDKTLAKNFLWAELGGLQGAAV